MVSGKGSNRDHRYQDPESRETRIVVDLGCDAPLKDKGWPLQPFQAGLCDGETYSGLQRASMQ